MRILAGNLKYKKIKYVKGSKLRPTRNIVRKSFFDTVRPLINDCVFLDLFAGVGSLGIEAISRGAKQVFFVDKSFKSIEIIKHNVHESKCSDKSIIIKADAAEFVKNAILSTVDVAYIDAPYNSNISALLENFFLNINKNAIVCIEHAKGKMLSDIFGEFLNIKSKKMGKNILDYFGVLNG